MNPEDKDVNSLGLRVQCIMVQSKLLKQIIPPKIQGLQWDSVYFSLGEYPRVEV